METFFDTDFFLSFSLVLFNLMLFPAFPLIALQENMFYLLLPVLGVRKLYIYSLKMELITEHRALWVRTVQQTLLVFLK